MKKSKRQFKYKNKWYEINDIIRYHFRQWEIIFIASDCSTVIKRGKKQKVITGSVNII